MAGAIPCTFHQCMKFKWYFQEIVIHGEWSRSAYLEHVVPFIEGLDGITFHAVEIMHATEIGKSEQGHKMKSAYGYIPGYEF